MQVDFENVFNNVFRMFIFKKLWGVRGPLASIVPITRLFYGAYFFIYYYHGQDEKGVTIIESSSNTR
jgi:hypothetical protein